MKIKIYARMAILALVSSCLFSPSALAGIWYLEGTDSTGGGLGNGAMTGYINTNATGVVTFASIYADDVANANVNLSGDIIYDIINIGLSNTGDRFGLSSSFPNVYNNLWILLDGDLADSNAVGTVRSFNTPLGASGYLGANDGSIRADYYGSHIAISGTLTRVPEPLSVGLAALGLIGLGFGRRKQVA